VGVIIACASCYARRRQFWEGCRQSGNCEFSRRSLRNHGHEISTIAKNPPLCRPFRRRRKFDLVTAAKRAVTENQSDLIENRRKGAAFTHAIARGSPLDLMPKPH